MGNKEKGFSETVQNIHFKRKRLQQSEMEPFLYRTWHTKIKQNVGQLQQKSTAQNSLVFT